MSEDESAPHAQSLQRCKKQVGLCIRRPNNVSRTLAVSIPWAIEHDNPVILGSQFDETARFEVLDHASVAVKKDERSTRSPLDVVEADPVNIEEFAGRRIIALSLFRELPI
jgi:hypothetical protein